MDYGPHSSSLGASNLQTLREEGKSNLSQQDVVPATPQSPSMITLTDAFQGIPVSSESETLVSISFIVNPSDENVVLHMEVKEEHIPEKHLI